MPRFRFHVAVVAVAAVVMTVAGQPPASAADNPPFAPYQEMHANCAVTHRLNDDPIVFPGRPGLSHNHTYIGNFFVDASTTPESLLDGKSSCDFDADSSAYWAPTLYKVTQVGAHIFYRWTGPAGEPRAFTGRYRGGERNLTPAILQGIDERIQGAELIAAEPVRTVTLGERTYTVAETAGARVAGTIAPSRRAPTREEVARINARLQPLEDAQAPLPAPIAGLSDDLPIGEPRPKS